MVRYCESAIRRYRIGAGIPDLILLPLRILINCAGSARAVTAVMMLAVLVGIRMAVRTE